MPIMPAVRVPAPAANWSWCMISAVGTFDASVISMAARRHEVVRSAGIAQLGGDDVDTLLLDLALAQAGVQDWTACRAGAAAGGVPRKERGAPPQHAPAGD